jgi:uncharacterized protein DUF4105
VGLAAIATLVAIAACSVARAGGNSPDPTYAAELSARADALGLADDPQWRALLHYRTRGVGPGVASTIDTDWFFQARDGKTNPRAELRATIARFFDAGVLRDGEPPQCAMRARYLWLALRLAFDPLRLPPQPCVRFDEWRSGLDPRGVTLIFPEAYMNNPSSMFGHTLLRVDAGPPGVRQDLLAYGVNFAADTGSDGGVTFAWKGILGYYQGRFGIHPYYDIVKQYGDWESRDIWEYQLALAAGNVDVLVAHLWELRGVTSDYYFFNANCSSQILALLEAARPDLRLRTQVRSWVIPADTVRAVVASPGLVAAASFRPSAATGLRHAARVLPAAERRLARDIARGQLLPDDPRLAVLTDRERAAVLGTAYDLLRYERLSRHEATAAEQHLARSILLARSDVPYEGPGLPPPPTPAVRPDEGHPCARVGLGAGVRDRRFYLEARIRPAYHDLMDPAGGYTAGAHIDFLALTVRWYTNDRDVRVHRFTLVDVTSVTPWDAFFQPISWKVATGLQSRLLPNPANDLQEQYVWRTDGGAGLAFEPWAHGVAYGFVDATADLGPALGEGHAIGPGAQVGLFAGPASDRWQTHLFTRVTQFALGDRSTDSRAELEGRLSLTSRQAIEASIAGHRDFGQTWIEAGVSWNYYF